MGQVIATELCKDVGLCKKSPSRIGTVLNANSPATSPAMCSECKDVVEQIQEFVVDTNSTYSGRIEQFLDKSACGQLPVEFRKDCVAYVHRMMPEAWDASALMPRFARFRP